MFMPVFYASLSADDVIVPGLALSVSTIMGIPQL
jgi:hypothetical protein